MPSKIKKNGKETKTVENLASIVILVGFFLLTLTTYTNAAAPSPIVLATGDWEPYYGEKLPNGGVVTVIVKTAFQRVGYELKVEWVPWSRAIASAKKGIYDGVLGAWYTEERTQFFDLCN